MYVDCDTYMSVSISQGKKKTLYMFVNVLSWPFLKYPVEFLTTSVVMDQWFDEQTDKTM